MAVLRADLHQGSSGGRGSSGRGARASRPLRRDGGLTERGSARRGCGQTDEIPTVHWCLPRGSLFWCPVAGSRFGSELRVQSSEFRVQSFRILSCSRRYLSDGLEDPPRSEVLIVSATW